MIYCLLDEAGRHPRIWTVSTGLPVSCAISSFCLTRHHTKTRASLLNSTRADIHKHGARLKRVPSFINNQYRSSAAVCGAPPAGCHASAKGH